MLRTALVVPVLAVGLLIALIGGHTATNAARHKQQTDTASPSAAHSAATRVAPRPAGLDASSHRATVTSTDFKFSASEIDAPAGTLKVTLDNAGSVEHEFVLLKTAADPASLKVAANGRVSESASVGEVSETKSGISRSTTFDLKPGRYVYVCNIPGHYTSGMRGVLVVK